MTNEVVTFYNRQAELIAHLQSSREVTLALDAEQMLQKNLPLAAASYFEHHVSNLLRDFIRMKSGSSEEVLAFFEMKAISRQYHSLFDWDKPNANKFFSHFGQNFKSRISAEIESSADLKSATRDFLELGNIRNKIVHQNYSTFVVEKSAAEIFALFQSAERFVDFLRTQLS